MRLAQLDVDLRPRVREAAHHLGQDPRADALEDADVQRAGLRPPRAREMSAWAAWSRATIARRVAEQQLPGLGQRDRAGAARALDQLLADDALEGRDLLADRRLRVAQLDRRTAERALALDGVEGRQMAQLDAEPGVGELRVFLDHVH